MKKHFLSINFLFIFSHFLIAQQGLKGEYYAGTNFNTLVLTRIDPQIDFDWRIGTAPVNGMNPNAYSIRWTGRLQAPTSGTYTFSAKVDDGIRLWIGNVKILDAWGMHDSEDFSGKVVLEKGKRYDLKVEYFNGLREGEIHLLWETPDDKAKYFGHNYKPIYSQYLSQTPINQPNQPLSKKAETPPQKPANKPVAAKPIPKPNKTLPSPKESYRSVNWDTVTKYAPKNVLFEKSKATMLPSSFAELDNLATTLKRFPKKKLTIEGHTDYVGDKKLNMQLSEERAKTVVDYLIKKGIGSNRLTYRGFGGSRPISKEDTPEEHAQNRRVEFIIE